MVASWAGSVIGRDDECGGSTRNENPGRGQSVAGRKSAEKSK
jgi:hypothetical protein